MDAVPPSIPRHGRHPRHKAWEAPPTIGTEHNLFRTCVAPRQGASADTNLNSFADAHADTFPREHYASRPHARTGSVAPASPEVISSLITSLSVISRPAAQHFEVPIDAIHTSPGSPVGSAVVRRNGSFGVDYGAFSKPSSADLAASQKNIDLDELAAAPPVIKTAKPPSGFSALTAPKSPTARDSGGLRSFLSSRNTSRPSSRGSSASKDADLPSLGSISVERGRSPGASPVELRKQHSTDSWGKKTGRTSTRLMYMTSKERLRDNEDRKRGAHEGSGPHSSSGLAASAMARNGTPRLDHFLAETSITEEPPSLEELIANHHLMTGGSMSPRSIPERDSSLRKTGSVAKRSSVRTSRGSKRDSARGAIPEDDYFTGGTARAETGEPSSTRRSSYTNGQGSRAKRDSGNGRSGDGLLDPSWVKTSKANHYIDHYVTDTEVDLDDGAPAPNIAQGKRRDREVSGDRNSRRRSGRSSPEPLLKRSSSKMKRLSGPMAPRADEKPKDDMKTRSVVYERPPSADSIDDAVEAYMNSPRLSQKIKHPQTGRAISFSEVGDPEGSAVFCCVGMGLTRYITAFYDELALTLKLRLITPDRPGVGDSEAYADGNATPLSWPGELPQPVPGGFLPAVKPY